MPTFCTILCVSAIAARIEIDAANFRVIVLLQSCSILLFFQFGQVQGVNCSLARKAHLKNNRIAMT